jgi:hypothetical protein
MLGRMVVRLFFAWIQLQPGDPRHSALVEERTIWTTISSTSSLKMSRYFTYK